MLDSLIQSRPCTVYVNQPHNNDVTSKTSLVKPSALSLFRIYQLRQLTIAIGYAQILAATVLGCLSHSAYNPHHSGPLSIFKVKGSVYCRVSSTC